MCKCKKRETAKLRLLSSETKGKRLTYIFKQLIIMKKKVLLFLFLVGLSVYAQKPKADFDVNITYNCNTAATNYINKSVGAVKYYWRETSGGVTGDFIEYNIPYRHEFYSSYSIITTLIAVSADGQRDTITKNIDIAAPSKAILKYNKPDSTLFAPVSIQFYNDSYLHTGDDSLSYSWTFDRNVNTSEKNPIRYYDKPGCYDVFLTGKAATCETQASALIIVKDTAQRGEIKYIKSACNQGNNHLPVSYDFGKKYQILNDTLKVLGIYYGNCGAIKTATIRYKGDTIMIKSWEVGRLTTCGCEYYFEINIPHYSKDSAIILFNNERVKSILSAVPQVRRLENSIHIYPNPVSDNFRLETDDNSIFPMNLMIKDVDGRKIKEVFIESNNSGINTSDLKSGIYILNMYSKIGSVTKKIIKL